MGEGVTAAWNSLLANGLRSVLTMLGVIIGVGVVIALVSVGQGASALITGEIEALGSHLVMVTPVRLSRADAALIGQRVRGVERVVASLSINHPTMAVE